MGKYGKTSTERNPEYLNTSNFRLVQTPVLSASCWDSNLEMPEDEVITVVVLDHISHMRFTVATCGSCVVVYFGCVTYYFIQSLC